MTIKKRNKLETQLSTLFLPTTTTPITLTPFPQQSSESESGLLRRLGRLWLTSQVRELERSGRAAPPTMLVPTAEALHTRLKQVKLLLRARAFILLVPSVGECGFVELIWDKNVG